MKLVDIILITFSILLFTFVGKISEKTNVKVKNLISTILPSLIFLYLIIVEKLNMIRICLFLSYCIAFGLILFGVFNFYEFLIKKKKK